jgi:hypothetical protein
VHERLESLVEAVTGLIEAFEASGIPYAFGGAIALSAWAEPRATTDIDFNLWIEDGKLSEAIATLHKAGVRVDLPAAERSLRERGMFAGSHGPYRVDIFVPSIPFYDEALRRKKRVRLAERDTWVLSAECLAVFKMLFFRPKDIVDVARLLQIQGSSFDRDFVRQWLVQTMGPDDIRVHRWEELCAEETPPLRE